LSKSYKKYIIDYELTAWLDQIINIPNNLIIIQ
jgi:hypothetical protein